MALFSGLVAPGPWRAHALQVPFSMCMKHKLALLSHLRFDQQAGAHTLQKHGCCHLLVHLQGVSTQVSREVVTPLVSAHANPCMSFLYVLF